MENKEIIKGFLKIQNQINGLIESLKNNKIDGLNIEISNSEIKENGEDIYLTFSIKVNEINTLTSKLLEFLQIIEKEKGIVSKIIFNTNSFEILIRTK